MSSVRYGKEFGPGSEYTAFLGFGQATWGNYDGRPIDSHKPYLVTQELI